MFPVGFSALSSAGDARGFFHLINPWWEGSWLSSCFLKMFHLSSKRLLHQEELCVLNGGCISQVQDFAKIFPHLPDFNRLSGATPIHREQPGQESHTPSIWIWTLVFTGSSASLFSLFATEDLADPSTLVKQWRVVLPVSNPNRAVGLLLLLKVIGWQLFHVSFLICSYLNNEVSTELIQLMVWWVI